MKFYTMGNVHKPAVLFFHAMGVSGKSSEAVAEVLQNDYFIVMPTLSAYCEGEVLISKENEIRQLQEWLKEHGITEIELLVASSLGADFAMAFLTTSDYLVKKVFFDGGQFAQIGSLTKKIMVPFLYLAIKSLYWSKGSTLKYILWCDDQRIQPYFIEAGRGLDYQSLKNMMHDCLIDAPFPKIDESVQKNILFEFGSIEEHFKYREAVMKAYPMAQYPIFQDMNHMQIQIRHPVAFAKLLIRIMNENESVLKTDNYSESELLKIIEK